MTLKAEDLQHFVGGQVIESVGDGESRLGIITDIIPGKMGWVRIEIDPRIAAQYHLISGQWVFVEDFLTTPFYNAAKSQRQSWGLAPGLQQLEARNLGTKLTLIPPNHPALVNLDEILGVAVADRG